MPYQNNEPLQEVIVNVAETKPPFGSAKSGTIVGDDGVEYKAPTTMLAMIRVGGTYRLSYAENQFNGNTYLMVKRFSDEGGQANNNGAHQQRAPAPQRQAPPPRPAPRYAGPTGRPDDPTPERIFVCGGLNAAITSQVVNPNDTREIIACVNALRTAWANTFAAPAIASGNRKPAADDMNDEIPF